VKGHSAKRGKRGLYEFKIVLKEELSPKKNECTKPRLRFREQAHKTRKRGAVRPEKAKTLTFKMEDRKGKGLKETDRMKETGSELL